MPYRTTCDRGWSCGAWDDEPCDCAADVPTAAALARAELAMARARHCAHGIDTRAVRCGECQRDCATDVTLDHPNGLGGEGMSWPCLVCGNPVRMDGSNYVTTEEMCDE